MSAPHSPTRDYGNYHLGHKADEALHLKNVEAMIAIVAYIALVATCFLVAPTTETPHAVFRRRAFGREQYGAYIDVLVSIFEGIEEFAGRFGIVLLRRDEGLQLVGILLEAIKAQGPQFGDEPVAKILITERRGGTIVVVADSQL